MPREQLPQHTIQGIIMKKEKNMKNGPKGYFYFSINNKDEKFTCWSQTVFDTFQEFDEVIVNYTIQTNDYKGRLWENKVISSMKFLKQGEVPFTEKEKEVVKEQGYKPKMPSPKVIIKSENGVIKLGGIFYRIKDIELELLQNEQADS